jgi:hypothetical protein
VAVSKLRAMSYELTSSKTNRLTSHNSSEKIKLTSKIALPVPAMAVCRPKATSCELTCSQSSSLIAQNSHKINKFTSKKPLMVPELAVSMPWAMSCELICLQSSSLIAQSSVEKRKYNNENTTASTGSGYEQAQGHELCAHKLKNKQMDCLEFK